VEFITAAPTRENLLIGALATMVLFCYAGPVALLAVAGLLYTARTRATCRVKSFNLKHLEWFLRQCNRRPAFRALLEANVYPDAKEITESVAMFRAVSQLFAGKNEQSLVLVVGDGSSCRTAALFAALWPTCCRVVSIDPQMRDEYVNLGAGPLAPLATKLECHRCTVEHWLATSFPKLAEQWTWTRVFVVAVHSHARVQNYLPALRNQTRALALQDFVFAAMPCCVSQHVAFVKLGLVCASHCADRGILSPKNTMFIWRAMVDNRSQTDERDTEECRK
jgi:hypothetical protein